MTVAYGAATGARLWVRRYNGPNCNSQAAAVAVSPGGGTVYVTGTSFNNQLQQKNIATVAYDAATGTVARVTNDQQQDLEDASSLAVSPTDGTVFAAGDWAYIAPDFDGNTYFTIAYSG